MRVVAYLPPRKLPARHYATSLRSGGGHRRDKHWTRGAASQGSLERGRRADAGACADQQWSGKNLGAVD